MITLPKMVTLPKMIALPKNSQQSFTIFLTNIIINI